jgi:hypothetical protein
MKRINITHLAGAAGLASVLAIAAVATAGKKAETPRPAAAITNPSTLMKFENVRVVNATPEQLAQVAREQKQSSGMKAWVDPASGVLRAATPEELKADAAAQPAVTDSAAAPEVFVAGNARGVALDESHMAHAVVHVGADGKLQQACIEDQPNEKAALAEFENAPEVDRHEK